MFKKLIILLLVCWSSSVVADPFSETRTWTNEEKYWGAVLGVALLADWSSTRYAARDGWNGVKENNPLLGSTPSVSKLDRHFIIGIPLLYLGIDQLDKNLKYALMGATAIEVVAAHHNVRVGLRFQF
jgi:hypothetical protein